MKKDVLRLAFTKPLGFCGYVPKSGRNMTLRKKMFRKDDPWVTTLNIMQGFYLKDDE